MRTGTRRDAEWFSFGANKSHGMPPESADRDYILTKILADPEWSKSPIRAISRHTGIPDRSVRRRYEALSAAVPQMQKPPVRTVTRGGTTYAQDTTNIGRRAETGLTGNRYQ